MPFVLHPFAAVRGSYIVKFQGDQTPLDGCVILPVIADADPVLADGERLYGPDFEVLPDRVRAYGKVSPLQGEEYLVNRIAKLEAALDARLSVVEAKALEV
jgi:hypothetical protein